MAASQRERAVFWFALCAAYGVLAGLATTEGVGYVLRRDPTADPLAPIAVPVYNPLLWLPAVLVGAGAWGPLGWLNTVYWLIAALLVAVGAARLLVRHPSRARRPRGGRVAARAPGRPAARRDPADPPDGEPPAPARAQSAR